MKRYLPSLPLLVGIVSAVIACSSTPTTSQNEPTATASQALTPTVTCASDPNIFNTGYNALTGGILATGLTDANWVVSAVFDANTGTTPVGLTSLPPNGTPFIPANVGNLAVGAWSASPYSNAQWISHETVASPTSPEGDWYYEYNFNLDSSVSASSFSLALNLLADNDVATVFVNGIDQSTYPGSGLPQNSVNPYNYVGFHTANAAAVTLAHDWVTGANTIIVQVKSGPPEEGFLANARPTALCPVGLSATKTASPSPYVPGQTLTYTVTVSNSGPGTAAEATVSNPLPTALAGFTWSCSPTSGSFCTATGSGNISDTVTIATGGALTYTVTGTVPALTTGSLVNTVTVTPPASSTDPACSPNCTATNTDSMAPSATSTTLVASPTTTAFGQTATLTATVSAGLAPGTPAGTVTFTDTTTGTVIGTPVTLVAGAASITDAALAVGTHTISAAYAPSNNFTASSGTATETVTQDSTTTALVSSGSPSPAGFPVTFTATVSVSLPGVGAPTGTVSFYDDTSAGLDAASGVLLGTGPVNAANGTATFSTSGLAAGAHSIVAIYGGDSTDVGSVSGVWLQTVALNAPIITVKSSSPGNTSTYGSSVTITVTVTAPLDGGAGPTGTVTFAYPGGSQQVTVSNGVATLTISTLPGGLDTITATYSGDSDYSGASGSVVQDVTPAATTTTLVSGKNPTVFGQAVPLTATVTGVAGGATPTGSVSFFENVGPGDDAGAQQILLGAVLLGAGSNQATFSPTGLVPGVYSLVAVYSGDAGVDYAPSTSAPITQTVNEAATTTALSPSSNPAGAGAPVTFTATVTPTAPGAGTPTGTVTFYDGATIIGTGTLVGGVATLTTSTLSIGTHSITASYASDGDFASSTSTAVSEVISANAATVLLVTSGSPSNYGASVTFTATVTSSSGTPSGTVTFADGTTNLGNGTLTLGVATFTTSALTAGTHTIKATYNGDSTHAGGGTASVTQVVNAGATGTTLAAVPILAVYGQSVTLTATVTPTSPGSAAETGAVTFFLGATSIGSATLTAGTATLTLTTLPLGVDSITATYGGDTNYATSTSLPVVVTVGQAATSTALSSSSNPSVLNSSVTFTATVTATAPGGGTPGGGTVTFNDGLVAIGTGTLTNGVATLATATLTVGTHSITAVYGGNVDYLGSTSAPLSQSVTLSGATVALVATPSPGSYGGTETLTATASGSGAAPTGTVSFANGSTTLGSGTISSGKVAITTTTLPVGSLTLTATYEGNSTYAATTGSTTLTVDKASTTTTLSSSADPSAPGESVTLTAKVTSAITGFSGTVEFKDGSTSLGTAPLIVGTAAFTTTSLAIGTHSIVAVYSGDTDFSTSTSTTLSQTVEEGSTLDGGAGDGGDGGGTIGGDGGASDGSAGEGDGSTIGAGDGGAGDGSATSGDGAAGDGSIVGAGDGGAEGDGSVTGAGDGSTTGGDGGGQPGTGNGDNGGSIAGGGIGCSTANAGTGSSAPLLLFAGVGVIFLRRRRRTRG